jgi:hypothetical protein
MRWPRTAPRRAATDSRTSSTTWSLALEQGASVSGKTCKPLLVTNEFVFVHLPKTGGAFLRWAIQETLDARDCGQHPAYRQVPPEYSHLPAICFERNPWDWYVSLWAYQRQEEGSDETFPGLLERCFARRPDYYLRLFARIAEPGVREGQIELGRFEHLREDFVSFLDRNRIESTGLRELVLTAAPGNVSERGDYRSYYDDELRELVASSRMARHYEF